MPVTFSEHSYDPEDPDGPFRRLVTTAGTGTSAAVVDAESPWVEPDYSAIPDDAHIPSDDERYFVWPGPGMVMPTNLLPDGSVPTRDLIANAYRIQHVRYIRDDDADFIISEYRRQQHHLRDHLGIPRARREWRNGRAQMTDTVETLRRIRELHEAERQRRAAGC